MPGKSGIYEIKHRKGGKTYVGSSVDSNRRKDQHIKALKAGTHHNKQLQAMVNKHGIGGLNFRHVENVSGERNLVQAEQRRINKHKRAGGVYNAVDAARRPVKQPSWWQAKPTKSARKPSYTSSYASNTRAERVVRPLWARVPLRDDSYHHTGPGAGR